MKRKKCGGMTAFAVVSDASAEALAKEDALSGLGDL